MLNEINDFIETQIVEEGVEPGFSLDPERESLYIDTAVSEGLLRGEDYNGLQILIRQTMQRPVLSKEQGIRHLKRKSKTDTTGCP